MGREARCTIHFRGETADGKALWETTELVLRGPIRARIPREQISGIRAEAGTLHLLAGGMPLALDLGEKAAGTWQAALLRPVPNLAEKLAVSQIRPALVLGSLTDRTVKIALEGMTTSVPEQAALLIAEVHSQADLLAARDSALALGALPLWCLHGKGKSAAVTDGQVREALRSAGFIDTKSCAVSDRLTATRYVHRA